MNKNRTFPISLSGYRVEGLTLKDTERLQPLYDACADYAIVEQGELPVPNAAELEFRALPPDRTAEDKFMFGLVNLEGEDCRTVRV